MRPLRTSLAAAGVVVAALVAASPASPADDTIRLPAPVTIATSSSRFQIARDGAVHKIPPRVYPFPRDASWYPATGAWFAIRHRHVAIGRWRKALWRSERELPRRLDFGLVTVGPDAVAFSYRTHGAEQLYLAPFGGRERRVARNEFPVGWTSGGLYTYRARGRALLLRSDTGEFIRPVVRNPTSYQYDRSTETLYFVAHGKLWRTYGSVTTPMTSLARLGLPASKPSVELIPLGRVVELLTDRRLILLDPDGSLFAETRLRAPDGSLAGDVAVAPDGHAVAFAASSSSKPTKTVYVLHASAREAVALQTERIDSRCESWASVEWHGRWLLYSATGGYAAVIDSTGSQAAIRLTQIGRYLSGPASREFTAYWSGQPPL